MGIWVCFCTFVCLGFLDKSGLVAPWVEWIRRLLEAAALFVDALVSVHDERARVVGTGLS